MAKPCWLMFRQSWTLEEKQRDIEKAMIEMSRIATAAEEPQLGFAGIGAGCLTTHSHTRPHKPTPTHTDREVARYTPGDAPEAADCSHWQGGVVTTVSSSAAEGGRGSRDDEVSPADLAEYMVFHNRKLFMPEFEGFAPVPFSHAVRRSVQHSPEGVLSIEKEVIGDGGDSLLSAVL
eukprot:6463461-Amphidinium_carterae.1